MFIIELKGVTLKLFILLNHLSEYNDRNYITISQKELAELLEVSTDTVKRSIKILNDKGYILTESGNKFHNEPNTYYLKKHC
jgi:DNA-binding MarR family transcriptional regulator